MPLLSKGFKHSWEWVKNPPTPFNHYYYFTFKMFSSNNTYYTNAHTSPAITFKTEENKCRNPSPSQFYHIYTPTIARMISLYCSVKTLQYERRRCIFYVKIKLYPLHSLFIIKFSFWKFCSYSKITSCDCDIHEAENLVLTWHMTHTFITNWVLINFLKSWFLFV